ncbi:hypothetical protein [Ligilactobacillus apodemi]|uniref:Uncharacterized protein n=1 Tax=Ligilactobacillus apodemi DSM 16634 = JCM 16172 TaxID=1423724 RepID=A0A0R1U495_9LACO|nr:hypothetical protein [Ligilactobacillus apodemi]KRL84635.1 hypothetical protein FC32_GL000535 [Ligilactobacillus apodemi DSM 16634 = JCM 16172]
MRFDAIDEIETYNNLNCCDRLDDEQLYVITNKDATESRNQTKADVIDYATSELTETLHSIINAEDDEDAFECAKGYLAQFDAIREEK